MLTTIKIQITQNSVKQLSLKKKKDCIATMIKSKKKLKGWKKKQLMVTKGERLGEGRDKLRVED